MGVCESLWVFMMKLGFSVISEVVLKGWLSELLEKLCVCLKENLEVLMCWCCILIIEG